jgi:hypothetical protein
MQQMRKDAAMKITSSELSGRSYRGALHVHTTCSDGKLSPLESCQRYRRLGFDFVFITDHDQWNDQSHFSDGKFKVFSALELSCRGGREHVVALGVHEWAGQKDTQEAINWVNDLGGIPILCHPFWSRLSLRRALELNGYPLIEVWNTHGGLKYARESAHFWDLVLEQGRRVYGVATDDSHAARSCGGGFVEVWAEGLSEGAILKALREGRFYSSCGPKVHTLKWTPEGIWFRTGGPVRGVALMGDGGYFTHQEIKLESSALGVECRQALPPEIRTYGRVEIEDRLHKRAWLQPVWASQPSAAKHCK